LHCRLFKATGEKDYLNKAEALFDGCCGQSWAFSWDSKGGSMSY
jgi:hypothetical protein